MHLPTHPPTHYCVHLLTPTRRLGYKREDLEGKNVSIIMPAPFSQRHNSYIQNYVTTGGARHSRGWDGRGGQQHTATTLAQGHRVQG